MTKNELVEHFKQNMPTFTGTEQEIEIKKALYIYVELGKMKSFDEKYYFGNSSMKKKMKRLNDLKTKNIDEIAKKRKIVCYTLSRLYSSILEEFGIKSFIERIDTDHTYTKIVTQSGKIFKADLQLDLQFIQTKSRLRRFEYRGDLPESSEEKCDQKALTKMLIEIGYIKDEKEYKNREVTHLMQLVQGKNAHEALKTILEDDNLYVGNEDMESVEVNKYYKSILKNVVPDLYKNKIFAFNCYRKNENKEREYTLCIYSYEKNIMKPYIYSKKSGKFVKIDIETLKKLKEQGLVFGSIKEELGARQLEKYVTNYKEEVEQDF